MNRKNQLINWHQEIKKKKEAKKDWEKKKSVNLLPCIGEKWGNTSRNNCPALVFCLQVTIPFPVTAVQNTER